nr:uncharacterized protein LOC122270405 [Parasteatoda tepidariorum]
MHQSFGYENTFQTLSSEFQSSLASSSTSSYGNPYLTVKNELLVKFRFRHLSDGTHGGLEPIIELHDCNDPSGIYIKASLYTSEEIPRLHVTNCLFGKHCDNGVCWVKLSEDFTAE